MHTAIFCKYYPYGYKREFVNDENVDELKSNDIPPEALERGYKRGYGTERTLQRLPVPDVGEKIVLDGRWKVEGVVCGFSWAMRHELPVIHFKITGGASASEGVANPARIGRYGSVILHPGEKLSEPSFSSAQPQSANYF